MSLLELIIYLFSTIATSLYLSITNRLRIHSNTTFIHGSTTTTLIHNGKTTNFQAFLRNHVPALLKGYRPTWWLPFGDMQTIFSSVIVRHKRYRLLYERKYILVPDGGCISLDITPPVSSSVPTDTPIVIVLHGLLGSAHSPYIQSVVNHVSGPTDQGGLGLRVIVMNLRGCARTPVLSALLYHPLMTDDLRSTILYASSQYPGAKLFALGFSLGAGYITNYLGEESSSASLTAAFNVSNVWDYAACSIELSYGSLINRLVYNPFLGRSHQNIIKKNRPAFAGIPGLDAALAYPAPTMSWFTDFFMARGVTGIDPMQFLYDTTCAKSIPSIRVPLVNLNAKDDPLIPFKYLPVKSIRDSDYVTMILTDRGGHIGWLSDEEDESGNFEPWFVPAVVQYFREMLKVDSAIRPMPSITRPDSTGMVRQVGKPNVGFLEVSEETVRRMEARLRAKEMSQCLKLTPVQLSPQPQKHYLQSPKVSEFCKGFQPTSLPTAFLR